jgi:hypothetical protein
MSHWARRKKEILSLTATISKMNEEPPPKSGEQKVPPFLKSGDKIAPQKAVILWN